jgi:hypothetical protein
MLEKDNRLAPRGRKEPLISRRALVSIDLAKNRKTGRKTVKKPGSPLFDRLHLLEMTINPMN